VATYRRRIATLSAMGSCTIQHTGYISGGGLETGEKDSSGSFP
jgi:hypothetical protein